MRGMSFWDVDSFIVEYIRMEKKVHQDGNVVLGVEQIIYIHS
jgi:hypothetical protein